MSISSVSADPLFSTIITIYILILLYFPSPCIGIVLSPVLISTSVILLSLLRLGAIQKNNRLHDPDQPVSHEPIDGGAGDDEVRRRDCSGMMVSWEDRDPRVGAPLEVIRGGPENDEALLDVGKRGAFMFLSEVYPETDSDSDSDFSSEAMGNVGFRWDGDGDGEGRDGMIEIELDGKKAAAAVAVAEDFSSDIEEEDNLIEIDLRSSAVAR